MKNINIKSKIILYLLLLIIFFFYIVITSNKITAGYERIPNVNEILDERINILAGISFLKTGITTGWSNLSAYELTKEEQQNFLIDFNGTSITKDNKNPTLKNIKYFNYPITTVKEVNLSQNEKRQIMFVQPFFDHPPLLGIISKLTLTNINSIESLNPKDYRFIPTHIIFWLNALLLFILCLILFDNFLTPTIAFLIYTSTPTFILSSRLALLENLLVPFSLITLIFLALYKRTFYSINNINRIKFLLTLSGIFTGLSIATKESGIAVLLMGISILLVNKTKTKLYLFYIIPSLSLGVIFYLYFFIVSPSLTWNIFINQTTRGFFGPLNFLTTLKQLSFHNFPFEGFWLFSFISIFYCASGANLIKNKEVIIGFASTFFIYLFFAGLNYPWYSIPFFPFLIIASAVFISDLISKPDLLKSLIFFALPFSSSLYWGFAIHTNEGNGIKFYRLLLLLLSTAYLLYFVNKKNKKLVIFVYRLILISFCLLMFYLNLKSLSYIIENWEILPKIFTAP